MVMDAGEATGRWRICDLLASTECSPCAPHHRHHFGDRTLPRLCRDVPPLRARDTLSGSDLRSVGSGKRRARGLDAPRSERSGRSPRGVPARWWMGGGRALELHLDRSWRTHNDIDVGILRDHALAIIEVLPGWDIEIASSGVLTPWRGSALLAHASQNNLWCRKGPEQPWCIDITIGEGDREFWVFRRDPTIRIPWPEAVLRSDPEGAVPRPDLQLLFKSKDPRPKGRSRRRRSDFRADER